MARLTTIAFLLVMAATEPSTVYAQGHANPADRLAAQREAMEAFGMMDGIWKGAAWFMLPTGEKHHMTQTERVGPFLDGTIRIIEGRGYSEDGTLGFNALGIISYNPDEDAYSMRSYAHGHVGDYPITPTDAGFQWEISAGAMTMRYTATIENGTWSETGERISPDGETVQFFEMNLERVGDSSWPAAGFVTPD